jgi:hypothetical protein
VFTTISVPRCRSSCALSGFCCRYFSSRCHASRPGSLPLTTEGVRHDRPRAIGRRHRRGSHSPCPRLLFSVGFGFSSTAPLESCFPHHLPHCPVALRCIWHQVGFHRCLTFCSCCRFFICAWVSLISFLPTQSARWEICSRLRPNHPADFLAASVLDPAKTRASAPDRFSAESPFRLA